MPAGWIPACCNSHHAVPAGCSANDPVTTSSIGALPTLPPLSQCSRQLRFIHPEMHDRPFQDLVGVARHERRRSFFFQAEDGIRDYKVTGVQTCALPISHGDAVRYWDTVLVHGFKAVGVNLSALGAVKIQNVYGETSWLGNSARNGANRDRKSVV